MTDDIQTVVIDMTVPTTVTVDNQGNPTVVISDDVAKVITVGLQGPPGAPGQMVASQVSLNEVPGGTQDGVNTVFSTADNYVPGTTRLYENGLRQTKGIDYIESTSNTIQFVQAPYSEYNLIIDYIKA